MIEALLAAAAIFAQDAEGAPVEVGAPTEEAESFTIAAEPPWISAFREQLQVVADHPRSVGLAVAIIDNGEVVLTHVSGETARGSGEPITEDTLFRAASVTKTFTGTLLAMLEADGTIELDLPAPREIIDLQGPRQPTWRDLASHRTGLPPNAYDNLIEAGRPVKTVREQLADVSLICGLGDCYTYQNVAFAAVEDLVVQATGRPFEEVAAERLLEPFGLTGAGFGAGHLEAAPSWARPHIGRFGRLGAAESRYDSMPSAASLSVSLNDMIAWASALLDTENGIDPAVRQAAFSPYTETLRETRSLRRINRVRESWYGLGWRVYDWAGETTLIAHGGALAGYGSQIVLDPETGFAFVALWNTDLGLTRMLWPTAVELRYGTGDAPFIQDTLARMRG
ncbi:MAG: beta-lactamase family protein [Alphaproteobacteria bacterium]|nr:beta-lactamase family protein [Alphaproteobacteria bacterium]